MCPDLTKSMANFCINNTEESISGIIILQVHIITEEIKGL